MEKILDCEETYKYLGIVVHKNLKFDHHIRNYIMKKVLIEINKLRKVVKKYKGSRSLFGQIFWKTKIRPIIEYAAHIWTVNITIKTLKMISKCQINFLREINKYGQKSCKQAILVDLSSCDIMIRLLTEKEKYKLKCDMNLVPRRIGQLYNERNDPYEYDDYPQSSKSFSNDYPHILKNSKKKKIQV